MVTWRGAVVAVVVVVSTMVATPEWSRAATGHEGLSPQALPSTLAIAYQDTAGNGYVKVGDSAPTPITPQYGISNSSWSPDGRLFAYTGYEGSTTYLYRMDTEVGNTVQKWACVGCLTPVFTNEWIVAPTASGLNLFPRTGAGPSSFVLYKSPPPVQFPTMFYVTGWEGQADGVIVEWADGGGSKGGPSKLYRVGLDGGFQLIYDNPTAVGLVRHGRSPDGRFAAFAENKYNCASTGPWKAKVIPLNGGPATEMGNAPGHEGGSGSITYDRSGTIWSTQHSTVTNPTPPNCDSVSDLFRWSGSSWVQMDSGVLQAGFGPSDERVMIRNAAAGSWNGTLVVRQGVTETTVASNVVQLSVAPRALVVALGDSYASGEGAPWFHAGTDVKGGAANNLCHRSNAAWPAVLARSRALDNSLSFRACSGAVSANLTQSFQPPHNPTTNVGEPSQLNALSPTTRLVTISMGGNDVGFAPILQFCATSTLCHQSPLIAIPGFPDQVDRLINSKYSTWLSNLQAIKARAPNAVVEVLLYPQIFPSGLFNSLCLPFDPAEVGWFRAKTVKLNSVLRLASMAAGVHTIEAENAFNNQLLCSGQPAANSLFSPWGDQASWSFHPNAIGHGLIAGRVGTHASNPTSTPQTAPGPTSPAVVLGLLNPVTGFIDSVLLGSSGQVQSRGWMAASQYKLTLNSSPVDLGTFVTDSNGNSTANVTIPIGTPPGTHTLVAEGTAPNGNNMVQTTQIVVPGVPYQPVNPARILDTRDGTGGVVGRLGPQASVEVQVTGRGGIPAAGVAAVVLNATAVTPSTATHLTVWPAGEAKPVASNVNVDGGAVVPNLVTVKVGTNGKVSLFNNSGSVDVLFDVAGYYKSNPTAPGARYRPVAPQRLLDTRDGTGETSGPIGPNASIGVQINGVAGLPTSGASAVALNVTAVGPSTGTHLTVWPSGTTMPVASNVNVPTGDTRANLVIAKVGADGKVRIFNNAGTTHVVVDIAGYFTATTSDAGAGAGYTPVVPTRVLDTRDGTGAPAGRLGGGQTLRMQVRGVGGVSTNAVSAVVLNVAAVGPSQSSHLTVWPSGETMPLASSLNFPSGQTRANLVVAKVGSDGTVMIFNNTGSTDVIADVAGWYT